MNIDIFEEGKGPVRLFTEIPKDLRTHLIAPALPVALRGVHFQALFQEFRGEGFSAWYSSYWTKAPVVLTARADIAVLELRISLLNLIRGTWDKIESAPLPMNHFQMGFTPHVLTRAIFDFPAQYVTFDCHFELPFLEQMGLSYKALDRFIHAVQRDQPAELMAYPHHCTPRMCDGVREILHNDYSAAGKAELLRNEVRSILLAALEEVTRGEVAIVELKDTEVDKLYAVKALIEADCPVYRRNDKLCQAVGLNEFLLYFGFKKLFGTSPYDYYLDLRLMKGKELLRQGHSVLSVAIALEYKDATPFINQFKAKFGYTPGVWRRG